MNPARFRKLFALRSVARFSECEAYLLTVFRVQQILAKVTHIGVAFNIDADQIDLPGDVLATMIDRDVIVLFNLSLKGRPKYDIAAVIAKVYAPVLG